MSIFDRSQRGGVMESPMGTSSGGGGGGLTSPLTTKGDVWGYSTVNARIPIGTNGQVLTADSAQTLGLKWATPAAGLSSPLTTKGDVWGYSTVDARVPVGTDGQVLTADSTQALGVKWATATAGASGADGAIQFASTGVLASDAATFYWDNTNKRLGVGVAVPNSSLHVEDATLGTAYIKSTATTGQINVLTLDSGGNTCLLLKNTNTPGGMLFANSGGATVDWQFANLDAGGEIKFYNNGSTKFKLDSVGEIVFTPNSFLDMSSKYIINVNDPVNPQDAATKNYVDTRPVSAITPTSALRTVVAADTILITDYIVIADTAGATGNLTLPAGVNGKSYIFTTKDVGAAVYTLVADGAETFDATVQTVLTSPTITRIFFSGGIWYGW